MAMAAVPKYLGEDFSGADPGARFGLCFAGWRDDWSQDKTGKTDALKGVVNLSADCRQRLTALIDRQKVLAAVQGSGLLTVVAVSTSPFVTGTGMEHPLENGFAFLAPYGLPYLPGSGIKGVLRRAAQDMAGVGTEFIYPNPAGWQADDIDMLFGKETESRDADTARTRGVLQIWDVMPLPAGDQLGIDVMTPHHGAYYRGDSTPADCESPVPIPFLVVPAGSRFTFHVVCDDRRLSDALRERWRGLLEAAFAHAFDWLGFGAKTGVGYGQMGEDPAAAEKRAAETVRQAKAEAARIEAEKPPEQREIERLQAMLDEARASNRKQRAGGDLQQLFREIAEAAIGWPAHRKAQVLPLLQEISKSWLEGDEKKRRKTYLDPLQGAD